MTAPDKRTISVTLAATVEVISAFIVLTTTTIAAEYIVHMLLGDEYPRFNNLIGAIVIVAGWRLFRQDGSEYSEEEMRRERANRERDMFD